MSSGTEIKWIQKIKKGNERAFKQLYEKYASYALRTAYAITRNSSDASDVVQETFIRIYRNIDSFDVEKPFSSWFYQILLNESRRLLARRKKQAHSMGEEYILDHLEIKEKRVHADEPMMRAMEYLSEEDQTLIILKYVERFTEKELAKMMGLNVNTVKSRLYRARNRLKEIYTGGVADEEG